MSVLDRRTFLRGIAYGLLGAVLGWGVEAIAAEAAPEEEERVEVSWTVPSPCWDCAVSDTGDPAICDRCDEYSEWTPITSGYLYIDCDDEPTWARDSDAVLTTYPENGWATFDVTKKGDKE